MRYLLIFILLVSVQFLTAQEQQQSSVIKDFKTSTNKFYLGTNIAPIATVFLNGENFQPELKILYKQGLAPKNHFLRTAYSFQNESPNQFPDSYYNYYDYPNSPYPVELNDSTEWRTGFFKNNNNKHFVKLGYEYQFKVGSKRNVSINMGADIALGFDASKVYFANDTITYRDVTTDGNIYREIIAYNDHTESVRNINIYSGISPIIAIGIPLKNRFDFTFEMAFDCIWSKENLYGVNGLDVNYRPSLMLSYRFDEEFVRSKRSNKSTRD